ncbi:hypothetical protein T492DRAFT_971851 [Pavlovales sp. CCMP2436]|nr:hypothetical protein T492DRAFT_971851 [Pavlovales sp. CCMP2436]
MAAPPFRQIRRRAAQWESPPSRPGTLPPAFQSAPEMPWLSGAKDVRLNVRASRCVLNCLRDAGAGELAALLAQPLGREALTEAMAAVGTLVKQLFELSEDLVAGEPLSPDEGAYRLGEVKARWRGLVFEGGVLERSFAPFDRSTLLGALRPATAPGVPSARRQGERAAHWGSSSPGLARAASAQRGQHHAERSRRLPVCSDSTLLWAISLCVYYPVCSDSTVLLGNHVGGGDKYSDRTQRAEVGKVRHASFSAIQQEPPSPGQYARVPAQLPPSQPIGPAGRLDLDGSAGVSGGTGTFGGTANGSDVLGDVGGGTGHGGGTGNHTGECGAGVIGSTGIGDGSTDRGGVGDGEAGVGGGDAGVVGDAIN